MRGLQVGVVRYAAVATAIARAVGDNAQPDCRIGHGRVTLTFRRLGATRWPEQRQIEDALQVAAIARSVLADDWRAVVRRRSSRAIEVVYEDAALAEGCAVVARWECVVPAPPPQS